MSITDILKLLQENNIQIGLDGNEQLKITAAKGAMTAEIMAILKENKTIILNWAKDKEAEKPGGFIQTVSRDQKIPLSFNQNRLWFIHQITPETASYNMPMAVRIKGKLNIPALEQTMNALAERHEVFQTILRLEGDEPYQSFVKPPHWNAKPEPLSENDIEKTVLDEATQPFAIIDEALFRVKLWEIGQDDHVFMINLHHMIADGISVETLLQEVGALYLSFSQGNESLLPELPFQYADFAWWQHNTLQASGELDKQLEYWQENLSNAPALLNLPTDKPRPQQQTGNGAVFNLTLNKSLVKKAKDFGKQENLTPFMLLLAAQQLLLGRLANQDDICIAAPIAGRHHPGSEGIVGFFVNSLILRSSITHNPSAKDFLADVKQTVVGAFDKQDAPFEMVIERLNVERSTAYNPVAQVGFNYIQQTVDTKALQSFSLGELAIEPLTPETTEAKYDMIWGLQDQSSFNEDTIALNIEYNTDLYTEKTIQAWAASFETLIGNIIDNPETPVKQLGLINEEEILTSLQSVNSGIESFLPLSPMQRDLYLDTLINPNSKQNYLGSIIYFDSQIDIPSLQNSINKISDHFSALRMRVIESNNPLHDFAYAGFVANNETPMLHQHEWNDDKRDKTAFEQACRDICYQPYTLSIESPIRFHLIEHEKKHCLLTSAHHVGADGMSLQLLANNLLETYNAELAGLDFSLPDDSFPSYVHKQITHCDNTTSRAFFSQQANNVEAISSPLSKSSESGEYHFTENSDTPEHYQAIQQFCQTNDTNIADYIKTLYAITMQSFCFTGENFYITDILAARPRDQRQGIGCYFEQRPALISTTSSSFKGVLEYLKTVRQQLGKDKRISNKLAQEIFPQSNLHVIYNFYITERTLKFQGNNINFTIINPAMDNTVNLMAMIDDDRLRFYFSYTDNVFTPHRFIERLLYVSEQVLAGVDDLQAISLTLPDEALPEAIDTVDYPVNAVASLIEQQVARTPDAIAVSDAKQQITYHALNTQANQLAHYLIDQGVAIGDRVAICHSAEAPFMVALLACVKAGACYVPVDPQYPAGRITHMLNDAKARFILSESCLSERLAEQPTPILCLDQLDLSACSTENPALAIDLDDPLYTIYTSGSTGLPKGASVSQRGELNLLQWYLDEYRINEADRVLIISALGFDLTQKNLMGPLCAGAQIVFPADEAYDPAIIRDQIQQSQITLINCAPSAFYPLAESAEHFAALSSLRLVLFGGEPIRMNALLPWLQDNSCQAQLINMYGPTECTDIACAYRITQPDQFIDQPVPIGTANTGVQLHIVDTQLRPLPQGFSGELVISGESLGLGYLNQPELTAAAFVEHPTLGLIYRTGDLVRQNDAGEFIFIQRIDHQVKIRGLRIELGEIEYALRQLNDVTDSLAMVTDDKLVGYILSEAPVPEDWRTQLANTLPDYMIPQGVIAVTEWPLTANGKIDRKALPALDSQTQRTYIAPRTETEEALATIWRDVLGVDQVGIQDNFFELGGHSLLAARAVARVREQFEQELPLREVFAQPTIEAIARLLEQGDNKRDYPALDTTAREQLPQHNGQLLAPLSFAQQRMLFIEQLTPGTNVYNMPMALRIEGELDVSALQQAFADVLARHQAFQTQFTEQDKTHYQTLAAINEPALPFYTVDDDDQALTSRALSFLLAPFSMDNAPLYRAELWQQSQSGDYIFALCLHHSISDGWSFDILVRDLVQAYLARTQGGETLPVLDVDYIDYTLWQQQWLTAERIEQQLAYWEQTLLGVETLDLPTDFTRPPTLDERGAQYSFSLPDELAQRIRSVSQSQGATLFMSLLTAYQILLSRYTRQSDIAVGTPMANRPLPELQEMVGLFINTLVIRNEIDHTQSFNTLLEQTRQASLSAFEHQDIPFELLVDKLVSHRDLSQTPLFQTMFILQAASQSDLLSQVDMDGLTLSPLYDSSEHTTAKFDLTLNIIDDGEGLAGNIEYRTALFKSATIERFTQHFIQLLDALFATPEQAVNQHSLLNEDETKQLQAQCKQSQEKQFNYPFSSVASLIEQQVTQSPEAIAVRDSNESLDYQTLNSRANQLAHYLIQNNISIGDRVAICHSAETPFMVALLACLKAGACYVPVDPEYPAGRISHILSDAGAQFILTQLRHSDKLSEQKTHQLYLDKLDLSDYSKENPNRNISLDDPLYTIYTSGSTGLPKGASVSHRNELNLLSWYLDEYQINDSDRVLIISALGFDLTQKNLMAPLCAGAGIVFSAADIYDPEIIRKQIEREQITFINCAPSAFYPLAESAEHFTSLSSLRLVLFGGEPIQIRALLPWLQDSSCNAQLINMYGPTECTDIACSYRVTQPELYTDKVLPIGTANTGVQLYIVDAALQPLPQGFAGELVISGESLGLGYLNQAEMTAEVFVNHPVLGKIYRTGDLVYQNDAGEFVFIQRIDHQVKIRGLRIELGEIETHLQQAAFIQDALVIATTPDGSTNNQHLVAYVISDGEAVTHSQVQQLLADQLPAYMIPGFVVNVDSWPLSANGKIDRKRLPEPNWHDRDTDFIAPTTLLQQQVAAIWKNVLHVDKVGLQDNFFAIGGHSLIAARVIAEIREQLHVDASLRSLFDHPTLNEYTLHIEQLKQTGITAPPITVIDRAELLPLSYAQQRLWFLSRLAPDSPAYNMPAAFRMKGTLNVQALENAFIKLGERHESLRTTFREVDGEPYLNISPAFGQSIIQQTVQNAELEDTIHQLSVLPFDLANGPLVRCHLLELDEQDHVLLLNMHHINSDGTSIQVLIKELGMLYYAYLNDQPAILPALTIQYADYANWQRNWLQGETLEGELNFWRKELQNVPVLINMPLDKPRPKVQSFEGALYHQTIPAELADKLRTFSQTHSATLFMSCLTAYHLLIAKYSQQSDITIGIPLAGRSQANTENIIGFFINALAIRCDLSTNTQLVELLQQVKDKTLAAFSHDQVPVEMLINELGIERDLSFTPVIQCAFNMMTADPTAIPEGVNELLDGLHIEVLDNQSTVAKFDLLFSLLDTGSDINFSIEYSTDIYEEASIARMAQHYIKLLTLLVDAEETRLSNVTLTDFDIPPGASKALPLTPMQRDIYLAAISNPDTLENSLGFSFNIPFAIDIPLWTSILEEITAHFDILRTDIIANTKPWQDIAYMAVSDDNNLDFKILDWSEENISDAELQLRLDKLIAKPYDITHSARVSHRLIKLSENNYWATMAAHHMILDGFGAVLIGTYLTMLYEQRSQGQEASIPAADNFADSITPARELFDRPETIAFWQEQAKGAEGLQAAKSTSHENILDSLPIPTEHYQAIKAFCKKNRITPPLYFKCLYALMIQFYCRAEADFFITEFNAGRDKTNMGALGCFYHTQPTCFINDSLKGEIGSVFKSAKAQQKASKSHLQISHLKQMQILPPSSVYFSYNYLMMPHESYMLGEKLIGTRYTPNAEGMVDFRVQAHEDELCLWLACRSGSFDENHFLERLLNLSYQLAEQGISELNKLSFLLPEENTYFRGDEPVSTMPLTMQIALIAHKHPNNIAVACGKEALSYQQLETRSNALANHLIASGINTGDRIGICLSRRVDLLTTLLAVIKSGACYIPIDPAYPQDRIDYIIDDSQSALLITEQCLHERFRTTAVTLLDIDSFDFEQANTSLIKCRTTDDDLLYMIYTSGSTGQPKGASVFHRGENNLISWYTKEYQLSPQDCTLIFSAIGFDLTQKNFFAPLTQGGKIVLPDTDLYDPAQLRQLISQHKVTHINCAPSAFYPIVELAKEAELDALNSLRLLMFGGETIETSRIEAWITRADFNCTIVNMYGPTECTDISTAFTLKPAEVKESVISNIPIPLGGPNDGVELYILNDMLQPVPEGFTAELYISGQSVGAGYWNKPELNQAAFIDNPYKADEHNQILYKTGDLVKLVNINNSKQLVYVGRRDFQVKLRGLRIELGEIESALKHIPAIKDTLVLVEHDELLAFALSDQSSIDGWREELALKLPDYMVPKALVTVDTWPLTPNGKIDRQALLALERHTDAVAFIAPRNQVEQDLATLWQEVLGVGKVGIYDNFFESGGDSLSAVRIVARIELHYDIKLPIASLFGAQNIAQLAHVIENKISDWSPIVPIQPQGDKTPIFAVHAIGALVLSYEPLARALGNEQPFYGIQAYGFEDDQTPFTDLNEMVDFYCDAILKQQTQGPYQLMGHSFGGLIAVEIARKLKAMEHEVKMLCLLDTFMPNKYASGAVDDALLLKTFAEHNFGVVDIPLRTLRLMKPDTMIKAVAERFQGAVSESFIRSAIEIIRGFQRMMIGFKPQAIDLPIILVRPSKALSGASGIAYKIALRHKVKTLGWHKITEDLHIIETQGDHQSILKDAEHVEQLASQILPLLEQEKPYIEHES